MPEAISNTSPLFYLHQIGKLNWLSQLFGEVWIPGAVALELETGLGDRNLPAHAERTEDL